MKLPNPKYLYVVTVKLCDGGWRESEIVAEHIVDACFQAGARIEDGADAVVSVVRKGRVSA